MGASAMGFRTWPCHRETPAPSIKHFSESIQSANMAILFPVLASNSDTGPGHQIQLSDSENPAQEISCAHFTITPKQGCAFLA